MCMKIYSTIIDGYDTIESDETVRFEGDPKGVEREVLNLYPDVKFETFEGFGGAITDAAGFVYAQMRSEQKQELMTHYFSPEEMNYRLVRVHMDSCDFSVEQYEAMSDPEDGKLKSFSFEKTERYILPMLADAQKASGGKLKLMLSPWSPPAFMKTNGQRSRGGKLKPEYRALWAEYICRYIQEFQARGYEVQRISLQNEPKATQRWDSCVFTAAEEKEFLRDFLYPALQAHGLYDVEIFVWDHNKERLYERVRDIVDDTTDHMVAGAAFHWYSGDHFEALDLVRRQYPEKKLITSESCLEYSRFKDSMDTTVGILAHEVIGDMKHGMCAFYDWNILLDQDGGPNHAGNFCHAPYLYDIRNQELKPQWTLKHFHHCSHFVREGARRIATTQYTADFDCVAYENPDGALVLIALNRADHHIPVTVRLREKIARFVLRRGAMVTCVAEGIEKHGSEN